MRVRLLLIAVLVLVAAPVSIANASDLVDRNARNVKLVISKRGQALLSYRAGGRSRHVLIWGAVNARHPNPNLRQVRFRIDYTGGWETYGRVIWRGFRGTCGRYDGPPLAWLVTACKAPDGSYWAVQSWQLDLPHRGYPAWKARQTQWELHVSHWRGPLAQLEVHTDWAFGGEAHDLFGRLSYLGVPVHGFRTSGAGAPDQFGRSLYIDTFDSAYGAGWKRETSIVARKPTGGFCYSFWPTHDRTLPGAPLRPAGKGKRYRITVQGPGVTPDVTWEGAGLHDFNRNNPDDVSYERRMDAIFMQILSSDRFCSTQR